MWRCAIRNHPGPFSVSGEGATVRYLVGAGGIMSRADGKPMGDNDALRLMAHDAFEEVADAQPEQAASAAPVPPVKGKRG